MWALIPVPNVPLLKLDNTLPDLLKYSILSLSTKITPGMADDPSTSDSLVPSTTDIVLAVSVTSFDISVVLFSLILLKNVLFNISLKILNPVAPVALGTAKYITSILSESVIVLPAIVTLFSVTVKSFPATSGIPLNHT